MSANFNRSGGSKLGFTNNSLEQETENSQEGDAISDEWLSCCNNPKRKTRNNNSGRSIKNLPCKIYSCSFCPKKFLNSQALGGHQNAHREEREEIKRLQNQMMMMAQLHMPYYYHSYNSMRTSLLQSFKMEPQTLAYHQLILDEAATTSCNEKEPHDLNLDLHL